MTSNVMMQTLGRIDATYEELLGCFGRPEEAVWHSQYRWQFTLKGHSITVYDYKECTTTEEAKKLTSWYVGGASNEAYETLADYLDKFRNQLRNHPLMAKIIENPELNES